MERNPFRRRDSHSATERSYTVGPVPYRASAQARSLPLPPAQAVMTALLLGFLLHALAAIAVFAARTAWRAALWLALPTLALGVWVWPLGGASPV